MLEKEITYALDNIGEWSRMMWPRWQLRPYQVRVAAEIARSVSGGEGRQFAVAFARQSGKDEMLAQLQAYLMYHAHDEGGSLVAVNPTLRPQGLISKRRLASRLMGLTYENVVSEGNTLSLGKATCSFLTAHPTAQARGETASLLISCNEAQDVPPQRWDAVFDPMGAAMHATQVFSGTVWTSRTLLARQIAYLGELERKDGKRRVFKVGWEEVAQCVPAYGEQVRARIAQFGRNHPFIRTEYFLEEIDAEGRLFGPARRAQMQGDHPRQHRAIPGRIYALLVDVAGADENAEWGMQNKEWDKGRTRENHEPDRTEPGNRDSELTPHSAFPSRHSRDATVLTVVEVDTSGLDDPLLMRPRYRVVDRAQWVGVPHPRLFRIIADLALNVWHAQHVVVDATGIGAGLAGFLAQALPGKVTPFVFSSQSKSQLGWDFLGLVESGRYKEYVEDGESETGLFWTQVEACGSQLQVGPNRLLRWGVENREIHDDLLVSSALSAVLDRLDWRPRVARGR